MKPNIAISMLDVEDIPNMLNVIKTIQQNNEIKYSFFDYIIHFDEMDNRFVPNEKYDLKYIKTAKNLGFYVDTHLMVENPIGDKYIDDAINYGCDSITIHYEIKNFEAVLKSLNNKKINLEKFSNRILTIGVSLKPNTSVDVLLKYSDMFSKILLMSVEPGFGSQSYINKTDDKVKEAKEKFENHIIQVDGGINDITIRDLINLSVDSVVVGSYLSKSQNIDKLNSKLLILNIIKSIESVEKNANISFDSKLLQIVSGGYGENDILIGLNVPNNRKLAKLWFKEISINELDFFISSKYHEYRQFAIFVISNMINMAVKENNIKSIKMIYDFFQKNIQYINNWDLTDEAGPNILAPYLLILDETLQKKELDKYISNENVWVKRIGIVSQLTFVRKNILKLPLQICDNVLYEQYHLLQKATGWVLRELYKKEPLEIVDYLKSKYSERKLPNILVTYACEKMSNSEKDIIKNL
ncbi:MAG: DNA alkylation repair protein [Clostridia bacterium]